MPKISKIGGPSIAGGVVDRAQEYNAATDAFYDGRLLAPPLLVKKTRDEQVLNSTALQDDDELFLAVAAGAMYWIDGLIIYDGSTTGDLLVGWSGPAGASLDWTVSGQNLAAASASGSIKTDLQTLGTTNAVGAIGAGSKLVATPRGLLTVAGVAGTLRLRWAQNSLDAGVATTVFAGSALLARRVA